MSEEPAVKRQCMMKIGTHSGTFHCDEVLACFLLKQLPQYKDAEIVRTRDQKVLDTCDIVVDVGGVFDASKCRFDHHQRNSIPSRFSLVNKMKQRKCIIINDISNIGGRKKALFQELFSETKAIDRSVD